MNHGRVVVFGSLAIDRIFDYPGRFRDDIVPAKLHLLNVSFTVKDVRESYGGTAGNIGYTLRLLGARPSVICSVGDDFANYQAWLQKHSVDLSLVTKIRGRRTAAAYIVTDRDDNQIAAFQPGAMFSHQIPPNLAAIEKTTELAILAPGNTTTMVELGKRFARKKIPFIFDPGQVIPVLSPGDLRLLLKLSSGFISNDYEATLTSQRTGISLPKLRSLLPFVVTTHGKGGAEVFSGNKRIRVRAAGAKETIDPTGAGDAFRAGFLSGLIRGASFEVAAKMGATAAVYTVEKAGTQTHSFTISEFIRRYRQNYKDPLPFM